MDAKETPSYPLARTFRGRYIDYEFIEWFKRRVAPLWQKTWADLAALAGAVAVWAAVVADWRMFLSAGAYTVGVIVAFLVFAAYHFGRLVKK